MNNVNFYDTPTETQMKSSETMAKYVSNTALLFTKIVLTTALVLLILITIMVSAPAIEGHLFPVVANMEFVREGDTYAVHGEKLRACNFISLQGLVQTSAGIEKASFSFIEQNTPTSRPVGKQSFGKWRIEPPGKLIAIYSTHQCHFLWDTSTTLIKDSAAVTLSGR